MAPGTRGVRAIVLHFTGEDSDQTGDVASELRVAHCSQSFPLS